MPKEQKEKEIGKVFGYYDHVKVMAVKLSSVLNIGDKIRVKGATTDFTQKVDSLQIEHDKVEKAKKGDSVGIKIKDKARQNDKVFLVQQ